MAVPLPDLVILEKLQLPETVRWPLDTDTIGFVLLVKPETDTPLRVSLPALLVKRVAALFATPVNLADSIETVPAPVLDRKVPPLTVHSRILIVIVPLVAFVVKTLLAMLGLVWTVLPLTSPVTVTARANSALRWVSVGVPSLRMVKDWYVLYIEAPLA